MYPPASASAGAGAAVVLLLPVAPTAVQGGDTCSEVGFGGWSYGCSVLVVGVQILEFRGVHGLRFMVYGLWFMVYGLWFMV